MTDVWTRLTASYGEDRPRRAHWGSRHRGSRVNVDQLIERWWTPTGRALGREVFRYLQGERVLPDEVGLHKGRADLRGIGVPSPHPEPAQGGRVDYGPLSGPRFKVRDLLWERLDLSHAWLPRLQATRLAINDCMFEQANCRAWRLDSSMVNDSSFARADLFDTLLSTLGDGSANELTATVFDGAKMSGLVVRGGAFLGCTFEGTVLSNTRFHGVRFSNCTFSGVLRDVLFDDRGGADRIEPTMAVIDFKESTFVRVQFRGCRLRRVELPRGVYLVANFPRVAVRADTVLQEIGTPMALALRNFLGTHEGARGTGDSVGVINRADLVDVADESFADLVEDLLVRASAQAAMSDKAED